MTIFRTPHRIRQLVSSHHRTRQKCRNTCEGLGRLSALAGPTATSNLSGLKLDCVKYWQKKWANPRFRSGRMHYHHT
jgi:hypothetical protein